MKMLRPALMMNGIFLMLTGIVFPLAVWGVAQVLFPFQANGSLVTDADGRAVGSTLIGQKFAAAKYFHPRPSAAGSGYDGANSSGTNLGPINAKLAQNVYALAKRYRDETGLSAEQAIPADAVTSSASGLDPDISPANALLQAKRVARARELPAEVINGLIEKQTEHRLLGVFGEPRVNVLKLNLALDRNFPERR